MYRIFFTLLVLLWISPLFCHQPGESLDESRNISLPRTSFLTQQVAKKHLEKLQHLFRNAQRRLEIIMPFINCHRLMGVIKFNFRLFSEIPLSKLSAWYDSWFPSAPRNYPKNLAWIVNTPYKVQIKDNYDNLSLKMGEALYGLTLEQRIATRRRISQTSKEVFLNLYHEQGNHTPCTTHRLWITSRTAPCEASPKRLQAYINSLRKLRAAPWEHNFWCVNPDDIPITIRTLRESGLRIAIRRLEEIFPVMKAKHVYDAYYQNDQFAYASDIARQNIVYEYGGVYSDLGTTFEDLTPFVRAYDYLFTFTKYGAIDQSFFGYKPKSYIIQRYLENLDRLYTLPDHVKRITEGGWKKVAWNTPPHLMLCIDQFSQPSDRFLLVPEGRSSLMIIDHAGSWIWQKECFGNKSIFESQLDVVSIRP
jgi:hypothetical protein